MGPNASQIASSLASGIALADAASWRLSSPAGWAKETYGVSQQVAYGELPSPQQGVYVLNQKYEDDAAIVTALQLSRAGVRLADLLNRAFAP